MFELFHMNIYALVAFSQYICDIWCFGSVFQETLLVGFLQSFVPLFRDA